MPFTPTPTMWGDPDSAEFEDYEPDDVEMCLINATWVCWALSGRKLHAAGQRVETYKMPPGTNGKIRLGMTPVESLDLVEKIDTCPGGEESVLDGICNVGSLVRVSAPRYPAIGPIEQSGCGENLYRLTYTIKSNLPPGTQKAVEFLALQNLKALAGDSKCKLPERVQSISRQNVSWTLIDPMDFLEKGKTGLVRVDAWLAAVNPAGAKSKARIVHPAEGVLVEAEWVMEGS